MKKVLHLFIFIYLFIFISNLEKVAHGSFYRGCGILLLVHGQVNGVHGQVNGQNPLIQPRLTSNEYPQYMFSLRNKENIYLMKPYTLLN